MARPRRHCEDPGAALRDRIWGDSLLSPHGIDQLPEKLSATSEVRKLTRAKSPHTFRQQFDPSRSTRQEHLLAFRCRVDARQPSVSLIALPSDQAIFPEPGHNPGH